LIAPDLIAKGELDRPNFGKLKLAWVAEGVKSPAAFFCAMDSHIPKDRLGWVAPPVMAMTTKSATGQR